MMSTMSTTLVVDLDYPVSGTVGVSTTGIIDFDSPSSRRGRTRNRFDGRNEDLVFGLNRT